MRPFLRQSFLVAACVWFLTDAIAGAQFDEPKAPPEASAETPPAQGVREVRPETYVVRDKEGRLVPMPNISYEDFRAYFERELRSEDSSANLPAYTLQELRITGTADSQRADLQVTATIRLQRDEWVRVPLRFGNAILRSPANYSGDGNVFVESTDDSTGYVCWMRASQDEPQQVSLDFSVPLRRLGNQKRLAIQVPRATSSELKLEVSVPDAPAVVSSGLLTVEHEEAVSRFQVDGLTPDFQISWSDGSATPVESRPLLQADVKTLIKVDGIREVTGEININVKSLRGGFDAFTVRLPVGTTLIPRQSPSGQYLISELGGQDETQGPRIQVKLERRVSGPIDVQLLTTLSTVANGKTPEFDAGGVEVEDAVRQTHVIDFFVDNDLSVSWRPGPNVQRTIVPEEAKDAIEARFESYRRSNSLRFQISPQQAHVSVDPIYVLDVESSRIRLSATLHYKVRRKNTYGINVYLPNWRVDQVLPEAIVDSESLDRDQRDPLYIPLKASAIQEDGEFTLQIEAVQEIASGSNNLSVSLPRPEASLLTAASVVVLSADNVALTVADEELEGLERDSTPPEISLPKRQQSALLFRERSDANVTVFAAELRQRKRSVSIAPRCRLEVAERHILVRQSFDYRIAYEPLRTLDLLVPRTILDGVGLRISDEQQALPYVEIADPAEEGANDGEPSSGQSSGERARLQVDLLSERIGRCAVTIEYELEMPELVESSQTSLQVPLVLPAPADDTTEMAFRVELVAGEGLQVGLTGDELEPGEQNADAEENPTFVSRRLPAHLDLLVGRAERRVRRATVVRKVWIQTWLEPERRRDRAVFRVATREEKIAFRLPEGARLECVALDGHLVESEFDEAVRVAVEPGENGDALREHVIELWYTLSGRRLTTGSISLRPPVVSGTTLTNRRYWSLATPRTDHLLFLPEELTPEMTWCWQGFAWSRRPRLQQAELEQWIGASRQTPIPGSLNHYLFGSFGEAGNLRCTLFSRSLILSVVSGVTLVIGLLLIQIQRLRHPAWLFVGGLMLLTAILRYPDLSMAVYQASLLGLGLVFSALLLKWVVDWREASRSVIRGSMFAHPDSNTVRAPALLADDNASTTPPTTASLPAEMQTGESSA